jgi:hypothetical protein
MIGEIVPVLDAAVFRTRVVRKELSKLGRCHQKTVVDRIAVKIDLRSDFSSEYRA